MEQEKDKRGGGWSLGLCMAVGVMLGTTFGASVGNTGMGAGLGLLGGYVFYALAKRKDGKDDE